MILDYCICSQLKSSPKRTKFVHPHRYELNIPKEYLNGERKPKWVGPVTKRLVVHFEDSREDQNQWILQQINSLPNKEKKNITRHYTLQLIKAYGIIEALNNPAFQRKTKTSIHQQTKIFDQYQAAKVKLCNKIDFKKRKCYAKITATLTPIQTHKLLKLAHMSKEKLLRFLAYHSARDTYNQLNGRVSFTYLGKRNESHTIHQLREFAKICKKAISTQDPLYWCSSPPNTNLEISPKRLHIASVRWTSRDSIVNDINPSGILFDIKSNPLPTLTKTEHENLVTKLEKWEKNYSSDSTPYKTIQLSLKDIPKNNRAIKELQDILPADHSSIIFLSFLKINGPVSFFHRPGVAAEFDISPQQLHDMLETSTQQANELKEFIHDLESQALNDSLRNNLTPHQILKIEKITGKKLKDLTNLDARSAWSNPIPSRRYLWNHTEDVRATPFDQRVAHSAIPSSIREQFSDTLYFIDMQLKNEIIELRTQNPPLHQDTRN